MEQQRKKRGRKKKYNFSKEALLDLLKQHGNQKKIAQALETSQAQICLAFKEHNIVKWDNKVIKDDVINQGYLLALFAGEIVKKIADSEDRINKIKEFESKYHLDFFELIAGLKTIQNSKAKYELKKETK